MLGADTAASTGMPAMAAFWASSKLARPLTRSTCPASGIRPARQRPADHLVDRVVATDVLASADELAARGEEPSRVQPAGTVESASGPPVAGRAAGGSVDASTVAGSACEVEQWNAVRTASMLALPQTPHELVV